jgi:hypothetical protein
VVGIEPRRGVGDQHAKRMLPHDAVQLFDAGFGKLGWNVHERSYGMQLLEVLQHKPQLCDTAGQCTMSTFNQNDQTS